MRTFQTNVSNQAGSFKIPSARDRYKIFRREERLRARGVTLNPQQYQKEVQMSSKKKRHSNGVSGDKGFNIKEVTAKTPNQTETMEAYADGYHLMLHGVAGTGKTFLSLFLGLKDVLGGKYQKLVIVRSVVPSRDMGFLPGSVEEKSAIYEAPYGAICSELFGRGDAYQILKTKGFVEFVTTSFIRGITLNNCIIVVDEFQNMGFPELDTIITRMGKNCRIIFSGDIEQSDLLRPHDQSGLPAFMEIIDEIWDDDEPDLSFVSVEFDSEDIVRSGIVRSYIEAKSNLGNHKFITN
jgi:phosphate starvation-inducible protein PhoH